MFFPLSCRPVSECVSVCVCVCVGVCLTSVCAEPLRNKDFLTMFLELAFLIQKNTHRGSAAFCGSFELKHQAVRCRASGHF